MLVVTRLDASGGSVLVICTECPSFREIRLSSLDATACRIDHERLVHGVVRGAAARFAGRRKAQSRLSVRAV